MLGSNLACWSLSITRLPENCLCSTIEAFKLEVCVLSEREKQEFHFMHTSLLTFWHFHLCCWKKTTKKQQKDKYALSSFSHANRVAFFSCGKHTFQTGSCFRTSVVHSLPVWDQLRLICNTISQGSGYPEVTSQPTLPKWHCYAFLPSHRAVRLGPLCGTGSSKRTSNVNLSGPATTSASWNPPR